MAKSSHYPAGELINLYLSAAAGSTW